MKKHIIFDLDGTLIDSAKGIYNAFVQSCEKVGLIPTSLEKFKKYIGPPIQIIAKNLFENANQEEIDKLEKEFRKLYDKSGFLEYKVYDGADRIIRILSEEKSILMSIVTNKPTLLASRIIIMKAGKIFLTW